MTSSPRLHLTARDLGVDAGEPRAQLHRRLQPQDLLDGARPQLGSVEQHGELVGVLEQDADSAAEQVDGGLEARGEHQARGGPQFLVVEPSTALAGVDELAHQVVAGGARSAVDVVGEPCR